MRILTDTNPHFALSEFPGTLILIVIADLGQRTFYVVAIDAALDEF